MPAVFNPVYNAGTGQFFGQIDENRNHLETGVFGIFNQAENVFAGTGGFVNETVLLINFVINQVEGNSPGMNDKFVRIGFSADAGEVFAV